MPLARHHIELIKVYLAAIRLEHLEQGLPVPPMMRYGTDLMQHCTRESNPFCARFSSINHRVRVNAVVKHARRNHSQQALNS